MSNYKKLGIDSANLPFKVSFLSSGGQLMGTLFKGLNEKITQEDLDKMILTAPEGYVYSIPTQYVDYKVIGNLDITLNINVGNISNLSWTQIISAANSGIITSNCVGQQKTITIGSTFYDVVLIGVNHDNLVSGGKANTTWQLKNCYNTKYQMNSSSTNSGGYASSAMHTTHLPSIFNQIQSDVRSAIKPVIKKASAGSTSSTIVSTNCNLFLLSEVEIFGDTTYSASGEGTQYVYWRQHDNNNDKRKGPQNNSTSYEFWWERSPYVPSSDSFCGVSSSGRANFVSAYSSYGVSFAFCI